MRTISGENNLSLEVDGWQSGLYFVEIKSESTRSHAKFVKANMTW